MNVCAYLRVTRVFARRTGKKMSIAVLGSRIRFFCHNSRKWYLFGAITSLDLNKCCGLYEIVKVDSQIAVHQSVSKGDFLKKLCVLGMHSNYKWRFHQCFS